MVRQSLRKLCLVALAQSLRTTVWTRSLAARLVKLDANDLFQKDIQRVDWPRRPAVPPTVIPPDPTLCGPLRPAASRHQNHDRSNRLLEAFGMDGHRWLIGRQSENTKITRHLKLPWRRLNEATSRYCSNQLSGATLARRLRSECDQMNQYRDDLGKTDYKSD